MPPAEGCEEFEEGGILGGGAGLKCVDVDGVAEHDGREAEIIDGGNTKTMCLGNPKWIEQTLLMQTYFQYSPYKVEEQVGCELGKFPQGNLKCWVVAPAYSEVKEGQASTTHASYSSME
ncbi:hypothetical protein R3P38DRAFT_2803584 [Favolaschia claudopus]|uniref:Uncharacterized protein n=1 Tax=Favolaschia claudopus TaxID=2862362 RepID=A0AAV9ZU27_9AGAR